MAAARKRMLGEFVDGRANNFDLLRLFAALLVLVSHSLVLAGGDFNQLINIFGGYRTTSLGVYIFFVISGFLVAGSVERRSILEYFVGRVLRIVPALAVVVFLTALVLGPVFTSLSVEEYFRSPQVYSYLTNAIPYSVQFYLPGLFTNLPLSGGVNGSLWTLPIESLCYVVLALLFMLGGRRLSLILPAMLVVAGLLIWGGVTSDFDSTVLFGITMLPPVLQYGLMFLLGSTAWNFRNHIPLDGRLAFFCIVLLFVGSLLDYQKIFIYLGLPYLILYFAYRKPVLQEALEKVGDLSYGTYLASFPIQQVIVYLMGGKMNGWVLAFMSAIVSMSLAAVSWRLIEKPATQLKFKIFKKPKIASSTGFPPL